MDGPAIQEVSHRLANVTQNSSSPIMPLSTMSSALYTNFGSYQLDAKIGLRAGRRRCDGIIDAGTLCDRAPSRKRQRLAPHFVAGIFLALFGFCGDGGVATVKAYPEEVLQEYL